jgi:hypothetical protein
MCDFANDERQRHQSQNEAVLCAETHLFANASRRHSVTASRNKLISLLLREKSISDGGDKSNRR